MKVPTTIRPSPAMVVAMVALFVAIGGTALALPGKNTVNSGDIIDGKVKQQDLAPNAVGTNEIADMNVTGVDLGLDAVTSSRVSNGSLEGLDISNGSVLSADIGPDAVGGGNLATITKVVDATPVDFPDQDEGNNDYHYGTSTADCPSGSTVISGGGEWVGAEFEFGGVGGDELQAIARSSPAGNGWVATAVTDVDNQDFRAVAYCLGPGT